MPRRRPADIEKDIDAFAAAADNQALDPAASHDFKAIRVGLNEYEYRILEKASRQTGRSKLNFIRYALLKMAKEVEP